MASGDLGAHLPKLGEITLAQASEVLFQGTSFDHFQVSLSIVRLSKQYVVSHRASDNQGVLFSVGNGGQVNTDRALGHVQLLQDREHQGRLARAYLPNHSYFLIVSEVEGDVSEDRVVVGVRLVFDVVVGLVVDVFTRVSVFLDAPLGVHLGQLQIWSISIIESSMMSTRYFVNKRGFLVI